MDILIYGIIGLVGLIFCILLILSPLFILNAVNKLLAEQRKANELSRQLLRAYGHEPEE